MPIMWREVSPHVKRADRQGLVDAWMALGKPRVSSRKARRNLLEIAGSEYFAYEFVPAEVLEALAQIHHYPRALAEKKPPVLSRLRLRRTSSSKGGSPMWTCTSCSQQNPNTAKFCSNCGTAQPSLEALLNWSCAANATHPAAVVNGPESTHCHKCGAARPAPTPAEQQAQTAQLIAMVQSQRQQPVLQQPAYTPGFWTKIGLPALDRRIF